MKPQTLGFISAIISAAIMGSIGLFVRHITVDGSIIAFSRFLIGLLFLTAYLLLRKNRQAFKITFCFSLFASGLFLALGVLCYIQAIQATALANAAFLLYLAPFIAAALGHVFLNEKIAAAKALLILLALFGAFSLLEFNFRFNPTDAKGYLLSLAAAFCYALFIISNRKIPKNMSGFSRAVYQLLFASLILLPLSIEKIDFQAVNQDLLWLLAIGFFHGFIAISLMILSLRYLRSYEYATVSYLEPIIAAITGYLIYHEALSLLQLTGCALIMIAGAMQIYLSITATTQQD